jgi:large subunit ribosomal protein L21|tara:strand:- start:1325 stop:1843 length:519 start_codon:yes stop_codon:yes gene_type:complete
MLAIFKTGGKQYSAKAGQILKVEKLNGLKGDKVSFTDVLAISDEKTNNLGEPILKDATIEAKIVDQIRDKKIIVFKKRKRQNYRLTQGHRQYLTVLRIESISYGGKKSSASPEAKKVKKTENKNVTKKDEKTEVKVSKKKVVTKKKSNKASPVKKKSVKKSVKKTTETKKDK